jgi:nucleotide-binding universal stress UspA family protein
MSESAGSGPARIVVGVDGSPGAAQALRWAARQAGLTGAVLEAIIAWQYPVFFGWGPVVPEGTDFGAIAERTLGDALSGVLGAERPDWVHAQVIEGYPAEVLVAASDGAELLVVGSRGYGGFTDALLGSVSTYCVHHAHGPVTVVRPAAQDS